MYLPNTSIYLLDDKSMILIAENEKAVFFVATDKIKKIADKGAKRFH